VFKSLLNGQSSKFLVALLSTASAALTTYYGSAKWEPIVVMCLGAVMTWLVPNSPKS